MNRPSPIDRELLSIACGTAALLLCEFVLGGLANYILSDDINLFMPMIVFGGVSLGSLIGMLRPVAGLGPARILLGVAAATLAGLVGLAQAPALAIAWIVLPVAGFGVYLTRVISEARLRVVVWALGIGGGALYLALNSLVARVGGGMALLLLGLTALAAVAKESSPRILAAGAAIVLAGIGLGQAGALEPTSALELRAAGFKGARRVMPPILTPLIRTDVVEMRGGEIAMITNGSRFAVLASEGQVRLTLEGAREPFITFDAPYFMASPEDVLVIGSAGGKNLLAALARGAKRVVAVDINPAVFDVMKGPMADRSGRLYLDPRVESVVSEGRHYVEVTDRRFGLITLQGVQTGSKSDIMSGALLESFLFTREAMQALYRALTPDGVLYFDEYERSRDDEGAGGETLVGTLAGMAPEALGLPAPERQCVRFSYRQNAANPNAEPRVREALLISKAPLDDGRLAEVRARLEARGAAVTPRACAGGVPASRHITDDRPFFVQEVLARTLERVPAWGAALALVLVLGAAAGRASRSRSGAHAGSLALFLTGVGYIAFVLGLTGPAALLLGEPQLATPVVFVAIYVFGLCGGLAALRTSARGVKIALVALSLYLVALAAALPSLAPGILGLRSLLLRGALVALMILPAALLAELPYIYLLGRVEGERRGWAYVWEHLGTVAGIPLGFVLQVTHGFTSCLVASAVFYALALGVTARRPAGAEAPAQETGAEAPA